MAMREKSIFEDVLKQLDEKDLVEIVLHPVSVAEAQKGRRERHLLSQKPAPSLARLLSKKLFRLCVLFLLSQKPRYGSEILSWLEEHSPLWSASPGAVYPLLKKLEEEKMIVGRWEKGAKRPRRVYEITPKGLDELQGLRESVVPHLEMAVDSLGDFLQEVEKTAS